MSSALYETIWLTLKLAAISTFFLMLLGVPLAWWLARTRCWSRDLVGSVVALPLVLPPTVLGFYLLVAFSPQSPAGRLFSDLFGQSLAFSFEGLVVGSIFYSLPFVVQPIRASFEALGRRPLEVAATLRAGPVDRFFSVALPLARPGLMSGAVLGFAHTMGEFGVVLMIGGNIPGETRVLSVALYEQVEALQWNTAHLLSGGMVVFSFVVIFCMTVLNRRMKKARKNA